MSGRTVLIALTALGVVLSYGWLEGRYEQADHRKAKALVRNLAGPALAGGGVDGGARAAPGMANADGSIAARADAPERNATAATDGGVVARMDAPEKGGQAVGPGKTGAKPDTAPSGPIAAASGSRRTLEDVLAARNPAARLDDTWSAETLSSCRGFVRVHAFLDNTDFAFDVDLVRHGVHPGNEAGKSILVALAKEKPSTSE